MKIYIYVSIFVCILTHKYTHHTDERGVGLNPYGFPPSEDILWSYGFQSWARSWLLIQCVRIWCLQEKSSPRASVLVHRLVSLDAFGEIHLQADALSHVQPRKQVIQKLYWGCFLCWCLTNWHIYLRPAWITWFSTSASRCLSGWFFTALLLFSLIGNFNFNKTYAFSPMK